MSEDGLSAVERALQKAASGWSIAAACRSEQAPYGHVYREVMRRGIDLKAAREEQAARSRAATDERARKAERARETAVAMVRAGSSITEAAAATPGMSYNSVRSACVRAGVTVGRQTGRLKVSTFDVLARLINTDDTFEVVGAAFGMSKQRVHQIYLQATAAGLPVRPHNSRKRNP